jgi:hypothetical protein
MSKTAYSLYSLVGLAVLLALATGSGAPSMPSRALPRSQTSYSSSPTTNPRARYGTCPTFKAA